MNQVTNLVQFKNLTDDEKAAFDFEGYDYECQMSAKDDSSFYIQDPSYEEIPHNALVYRLKIEPEKWYY